ncbi:hypothetical protein HNP60_002673 [Sphingobium sp. B1D3A]|uniref:Uncharacterized protein n=1 Tax=Sphingobium lignivorans TaxID=2735886 RepID=A0ABR6NHF0_9SPHN|nr:hypothetical protein [Sphingobium lignivorans]
MDANRAIGSKPTEGARGVDLSAAVEAESDGD